LLKLGLYLGFLADIPAKFEVLKNPVDFWYAEIFKIS